MVVTDLFEHQFIPSKRKSDRLMIVLHGKGDSLDPFLAFDKELGIRGMNYLLLNAPRKYLDGFSWYGDGPGKKTNVMKIRKKMFQLLEDLQAEGWSTDKIFLFGFSQGCLVSADVALNYPKKLAGVVGVSGYFHFFPRWKKTLLNNKKTPWLVTHGIRDDVLPLKNTKFGIEKLRSAGLKIDFIVSGKKHALEEKEYPLIRKWVQQRLS
jgi:phospholipase/carboxylesterase